MLDRRFRNNAAAQLTTTFNSPCLSITYLLIELQAAAKISFKNSELTNYAIQTRATHLARELQKIESNGGKSSRVLEEVRQKKKKSAGQKGSKPKAAPPKGSVQIGISSFFRATGDGEVEPVDKSYKKNVAPGQKKLCSGIGAGPSVAKRKDGSRPIGVDAQSSESPEKKLRTG